MDKYEKLRKTTEFILNSSSQEFMEGFEQVNQKSINSQSNKTITIGDFIQYNENKEKESKHNTKE